VSCQKQPLTELLRPQQLSELTLPRKDIDCLQRMVESGWIMNMIFYGKPGLGKTSAARTLIRLVDQEHVEINPSSLLQNVEGLRRGIEGFVTTMTTTKYKICFIDEADYLPNKLQDGLRELIDRTPAHCRFLFTVNDLAKIDDALRSRMIQICFDIGPAERPTVIEQLKALYEAKLHELGIEFDSRRLRDLVGIYYPDLRAIANKIEYEFA
jgi:replication-associated recombination protein RarA